MNTATDSLRFRFLVSTVIWIGLGIVAGGLLVSAVFRWNLINTYHDELKIHLEELAVLTALDPSGQPYLLRRLSDPRYLPENSGFYWQVDRQGFRTITSPSLGAKRLKGEVAQSTAVKFAWTGGPKGKTLEYGQQLSPTGGGPSLRLMIASDKWLVDATMADFNHSLAIALGLFAALMIAGGILQFTYGLRPLGMLAKAIADVRTGRASRMQGQYPTEVRPLVNDLNALLDANAEAVSRSRILAGNLAHGLRTPLAILIDEAESLEKSGNGDAARTILHEAMRMRKQIDFHLARARSAGAKSLPGQVAPLLTTIEPLIRAMGRLHQNRGITFDILPSDELVVACDAVDLSEILSNLLDNAGKWATSRCSVHWEKQGQRAQIFIDDDGLGLPPELRGKVFEAGKRLDDLTPGTGLGLAISRDLARIYGGDVTLAETPGEGLRVVVDLPVI